MIIIIFNSGKSALKKSMWTCLACFYFVHGNSDVVNEACKTHSCEAIPQKDSNLKAFKRFVSEQFPATEPETVSEHSVACTQPPPPPPPQPTLVGKPTLSWEEIKALKVRKFSTVKSCPKFEPKTKHTMKYSPTASKNPQGFITAHDALTAELKEVLRYTYFAAFSANHCLYF